MVRQSSRVPPPARESPPYSKGGRWAPPPRCARSSSYSDDYRVTPELLQDPQSCTASCCPQVLPVSSRRHHTSPGREDSAAPRGRHRSSHSPSPHLHSSQLPSGSHRYSSSPSRYSSPSRHISSSQRYPGGCSPSRYSSPARYSHSPARYQNSSSSPRYSSPSGSPVRSSAGSCSTCCSSCCDPSPGSRGASPHRGDNGSPHRRYSRYSVSGDRTTTTDLPSSSPPADATCASYHTCVTQYDDERRGARKGRRGGHSPPDSGEAYDPRHPSSRGGGKGHSRTASTNLGILCAEHSRMMASPSRRSELTLLLSSAVSKDKPGDRKRRSEPDSSRRLEGRPRNDPKSREDRRSRGAANNGDARQASQTSSDGGRGKDVKNGGKRDTDGGGRARRRLSRDLSLSSEGGARRSSSLGRGGSQDRRSGGERYRRASRNRSKRGALEDWKDPKLGKVESRRDEAALSSGGNGRKRGEGASKGGSLATFSNREIIHHMVSQTKAQKKQIRSLENEVERLRGCDVLAQCEVRQRDVEWRPGDVLGEGSFSTVYRGVFCGIDVAVKELKLKLSQDDKNYFRSEAALLQQLHHPRVVLLMGVCSSATRPFMLLEYMMGGSLHALIHGDGRPTRLDHATYFCIARDVAQGINYLHKHDPQVLHLDLKSMNVLLDAYTRAKIADFGFSILRRSRSPAERGAIRGTPAWMSPELLTKGEVSAKCDVYSYAIILWEMLTSEQPFRGYDVLQILEAVESGQRPPLPSSNVSRELRELITSCWAQNPALRPSFAEVLGALEEASVPPSWRGLFQRAHLPTSLPQDPPLARNMISALQESIETLRRNKERKEENNRVSRSVSARGEASVVISSRGRQRPQDSVGDRRRPSSNARDRSKARDSSKLRDRSAVWDKGAKGRDRSRARDKSRDPAGRRFSKPDGAPGKKRKGGRGAGSETRNESKTSKGEVSNEKYSKRKKSPGKLSRNKSKRDTDHSVEYSRAEISSRRRATSSEASGSSELQQDSLEGSWEAKRKSSSDKKSEARKSGRQDSAGESQYSSWSSDEAYSKPYSKHYSKPYSPSRRDKVRSKAESPQRRAPAKQASPPKRQPSPVRRSSPLQEPVRHKSPVRQKSPTRRRDEARRRDSWAGASEKPGLILTAEQLMDQKQRLRPVRPSALPDISGMPEKSLQDLSLLLRMAMNRRREAFPPSMPSDDQYSDWH